MVDYLGTIKNKKNVIPDWKLFEYISAVQLNMLVWEDVDAKFFEQKKLPFKSDYGIDLIDSKYTKTAQVKFYGPNTPVTWKSVSTYIAYNHILGIKDMTLVTTPEAKISKMVIRSIPNIIRLDINTWKPPQTLSYFTSAWQWFSGFW
jgi:hypothetical protein